MNANRFPFAHGFLVLFPALGLIASEPGGKPPSSDSKASAPPLKPPTEVIEFSRQTLVLKPTRDDITVGCVVFSLHFSDVSKRIPLEAIRVNGARPETETLYLKQVGKNQFELPALKIEYSSKDLDGALILTLKPWFNELTNQYDSPYYENVPDRYALLSYCTKEDDDPSKQNARLGANRVKTLKEFKERLASPLVIKLNQKPLREEWGRYPMLPPGNTLSADDLKAVAKAVQDKGEKHLITISAADSDHATVIVGDGNYFESARTYKMVRSEVTWRVEGVKDIRKKSW